VGFSGFWAFLWFVCFCYLADKWRKTSGNGISSHQRNNCQAAIAFSFFSIFTWVSIVSALMVSRHFNFSWRQMGL